MPKQREPREGYIAVGRVIRPWGLRGDVKVESLSDFPEERFEPGASVWVDSRMHTVEYARWQKGMLYLKLSGIDDPDGAEDLRDFLLEVPESALQPLDEDEFYHHQLIGLRATSDEDQDLGSVTEVLTTGSNDVLVVQGPLGEILVPFIDEVVLTVDIATGGIRVHLLEGMVEQPKKPKAPYVPHWKRRRQKAEANAVQAASSPQDNKEERQPPAQSAPDITEAAPPPPRQ